MKPNHTQLKSFFLVLIAWLSIFATDAQTVTILHVFPFGHTDDTGLAITNSEGISVVSRLLISTNKIYGTASGGGLYGNGTLFSMDVNGSNFTVLHTFSKVNGSTRTNADGASPSGLIRSGDALYGTTSGAGPAGWGTLFSLGTNGDNFTTLHVFTNQPDGGEPNGNLLLIGDTLYGTTDAGGTGLGIGYGTIYSVRTNGTNFVIRRAFTSTPDGQNPGTGLVLSGGKLFGTTSRGGTNAGSYGTVFSIGTNGTSYTRLRSFTNAPDGNFPQSTLVISGGRIFGTTSSGGTNNNGVVYSLGTNGASYTVLYKFTNSPDGSGPAGDLLLSSNTLYGVTSGGGTNGFGSVFTINTNGSGETVLHSYTIAFDGFFPAGGPVLSGQTLYLSSSQGAGGEGAIISIDLSGPPPAISNIVANADGSVTIHFSGGANKIYLVQETTNLIPPIIWQNVSTNTAAGDGTWFFQDTNVTRNPAQFYRAAKP